jgi:hypothetical protein
MATDMTGYRGHVRRAVPLDVVIRPRLADS